MPSSSSDSGDLFFYGGGNKRVQPPQAVDDDDDDGTDETPAVARLHQGRPGRPPKRRRDGLAQTLQEVDPDDEVVVAEKPQIRPPGGDGREGSGSAALPVAADDDVEAWLHAASSRAKTPRQPALTAEQQALLQRNAALRQELTKTVAEDVEADIDREPHACDDEVRVAEQVAGEMHDSGQREGGTAAAAEPSGSFMLKLRTDTGVEQKFNVRPDTPFSKLFDAFFAKHVAFERRTTRFTFDGDPVRPDDTPDELGIDEDGYVVDVKTNV